MIGVVHKVGTMSRLGMATRAIKEEDMWVEIEDKVLEVAVILIPTFLYIYEIFIWLRLGL